jgi:membrane protease YdiL (CAAX protease family)
LGIIATAGALSLICFVLCLPGLRAASTRPFVFLSIFFLFVYTTATDLRTIFPRIPDIPGHYNWTGKVLELVVCLSAVAILIGAAGWDRRELGLTTSFNPRTGKDVLRFLIPVLVFETIALWFLIPGQVPTFEDHLFQLTAPGVTEELAFRGILMALLDRAFLGRRLVLGAHLGWSAVVTSILFGLWHGLDVSAHFHVSLAIAPMVIPLLGGFVLAWCRARSGNLLLPIFAHSGMNEVANLIALAKAKA